MTNPMDLKRRTPLRRHLDERDARWRAIAGTAIADQVGQEVGSGTLTIADLTPLPRLGFKGPGTIAAMKKRGIAVEQTPNRAFRQSDGGLCLVLAPGEVILLSNLDGDGAKFEEILASWRIEDEERTYPVPRRDSHAWFAVAGTDAPAFFAKICAIDLRPQKFAPLQIAQTSVAKMTAIITRADSGKVPFFHVLADSAAALYFCTCLLDAAHEFGGRLVGLRSMRESADHG